MNLLLVDDEAYVIESIRKNVGWEQLGFEQIYTASSMEKAMSVVEMVPIHIVVSDIVMPQGSGFDFVSWLREKDYNIQVVFLTSYAEFDYAKRAIALNSVDYLLKPIDYDMLTQALMKASERAAEVRQYQSYCNESKIWAKDLRVVHKNYWKNYLENMLSEAELLEALNERNMDDKMGEQYFVLYIHIKSSNKTVLNKNMDETLLMFLMENVLGELLDVEVAEIKAILPEGNQHYTIVCRMEAEGYEFTGALEYGVFETFLKWFREKVGSNIWCGVSYPVLLGQLYESLEKVKRMRENSLAVWNRVLHLKDFEQPIISYPNPPLMVWKVLMREQKLPEIIKLMEEYVEQTARREMVTKEILTKFRMDVVQMVYTWLAEQEIKAYLLFSGKEDEVCYQTALEGAEEAKKFAINLITKAVEYSKYIHKTESVAEQLKQYIDAHYQEEIRRDELAELVFLNTDYMARIFKKEYGMSISTYMLQRRVDEAKKLLTQSDLPINTVSIYVGYSNFSYFTKMFRENTGYSPLEYRRKYKNLG